MDLKTLGSTFVLVFLAELGDKTQLATFGLAAEGRSRLAVFLGATLALATTSFVAVVFGAVAARHVPARTVRVLAGLMFVALGAFLVFRGLRG